MSLNLRMDAVVKQKKRQMFPREHSKDHEGIGWYRHIANSQAKLLGTSWNALFEAALNVVDAACLRQRC